MASEDSSFYCFSLAAVWATREGVRKRQSDGADAVARWSNLASNWKMFSRDWFCEYCLYLSASPHAPPRRNLQSFPPSKFMGLLFFMKCLQIFHDFELALCAASNLPLSAFFSVRGVKSLKLWINCFCLHAFSQIFHFTVLLPFSRHPSTPPSLSLFHP